MFGLQTDANLLRRLREAARQPLTKEELHRQKVSFVYGNLPSDSTITREQVEAVISGCEGETVAA
jgi:hypothetical protein